MGFKLEKANHGKLILIGASLLMWLVMIVLFKVYGYNDTWHLWNIDPQKMPFMDFRLIPGSADSFRNGFEPSVENPYDPNGRIFNYPAFWRLFFYTGVSQADTVWISIAMLVLFFISVFVFPEKLSVPGAIAMLLVLFSPAAILLYERGNVDLIVFVICVLIVLAGAYSAYLATLLIMFGTIVKLFPFLGVTVLLREPRKKFLALFAACFLVAVSYMLATVSSVKASWNLTMRGDGASYGTDVFVTRYGPAVSRALSQWLAAGQLSLLLKYGSLAAAVLVLLALIFQAFRKTEQPTVISERNLAAFRMGASIYVGTFMLGNNWDYRLAFLVLVVPQLVEWIHSPGRTTRLFSWLSLALVILSCWHFWISAIPLAAVFRSVEESRKFWFLLDEAFNWLLFAGLAYLLFVSMPAWVKELPAGLLSNRALKTQHGHEQDRRTAP